jgi:nucleotidyltransferase/DNA polymerase involved in DNA repair
VWACADYSLRIRQVISRNMKQISQLLIMLFRYKDLSLTFYSILLSIADDVQAVSVDEALIDVTTSVEGLKTEHMQKHEDDPNYVPPDFAKEFDEDLRDRIREDTGCEGKVQKSI